MWECALEKRQLINNVYLKIYYSLEICPVSVRDWLPQGSVITRHHCQPPLQLLNFLLFRPDVIVQAVDPSELIRDDSLQARILFVSPAIFLLAEPLGKIHH